MPATPDYLAFSVPLAYQAGKLMEAKRKQLDVRRKFDGTLVTQVDLAIQKLVIDAVKQDFPGHTVIGEEESYGPRDALHRWHVDPLDGTGEYVAGKGPAFTYGFGIAKEYDGKLEMGLFYNPSRKELFTAVNDRGAYLNGQRIHVNGRQLEHGVPYDYAWWDDAPLDPKILSNRLGSPCGNYSAIYQACLVAAGKLAFSVFPGDTLHDIAPGAIIVQEADGMVTDIRGRSHNWHSTPEGAIFSNGIVHQEVLGLLNGSASTE